MRYTEVVSGLEELQRIKSVISPYIVSELFSVRRIGSEMSGEGAVSI